MEKIRLGIIGFGNMGTAHAKNVWSGLVPKMKLSAICDILPERLELAKELYPNDIMFGTVTDVITVSVGNYTAYSVGWIDQLPEECNVDEWWK